MLAEPLRRKWSEGESVLGTWLAIPSLFAAELTVVEGVDYACVDQQHGVIDYGSLVAMLCAVEARGAVPLTRVAGNDATLIARALDAGAHGVVVPMVSTPEDAVRAVQGCRYPPAGVRSFGPIRASISVETADLDVHNSALCLVMIETAEGVQRCDEIVETRGVDGVYIGPADLAIGLGFPPDLDKTEPEHVSAVQKILGACKAAGKIAGIQCGSGESARRYVEEGFNLVTVAKDSNVLRSAMIREFRSARGDSGKEVSVAYS